MDSKGFSLDRLPVGEKATVSTIRFDGMTRRRLQDLGLIEGTEIKSLYKSPAGNPIAYLLRGAVIALRSDVSENILMTQDPIKKRKNNQITLVFTGDRL